MADQSRLDVLEGRVEELSRHWDRLFGEIGRLDQKIDTLGGALSARTDTLSARIDALDEKCDRRFDAVDRRFEALEQKVDRRFEAVDRRFNDLHAELSKQFRWTLSDHDAGAVGHDADRRRWCGNGSVPVLLPTPYSLIPSQLYFCTPASQLTTTVSGRFTRAEEQR